MSPVKAITKRKSTPAPKKPVKEVVVELQLPKGAERMKSGRIVLNDGRKLEDLPESGKCNCGSKPITWQSRANPAIMWYCSHVMHGNNGRFWTDSGIQVIKTRRTSRGDRVER